MFSVIMDGDVKEVLIFITTAEPSIQTDALL